MKHIFLNLKAVLSTVLIILNTVIWVTPMFFVKLTSDIFRSSRGQKINLWIAQKWIDVNNFFLKHIQKIKWEVQGLEGLKLDKSYLIISNHQSWTDIIVLQKIFNRRIPFPRFFIKKQLRWLPFLGWAFQALDFPMMNRFSKEYLKKHPEKKGEDMLVTQKICRKIAKNPVSLINFVEGTRFTAKKHQLQRSPYKHLLLPRAGGLAYALEAFEGKINTLIDVTIIYPQRFESFWEFLQGKSPEVIVHIKKFIIPESILSGQYSVDRDHRVSIQNWMNELWQTKNITIEKALTQQ